MAAERAAGVAAHLTARALHPSPSRPADFLPPPLPSVLQHDIQDDNADFSMDLDLIQITLQITLHVVLLARVRVGGPQGR